MINLRKLFHLPKKKFKLGDSIADYIPSYNGETKFKVGEIVSWKKNQFKGIGEITWVNYCDEEQFEYAIKGLDFLLWEDEIIGRVE